MAERSNRQPCLALPSFGLGLATVVTIALELKRYLSADAEPTAL